MPTELQVYLPGEREPTNLVGFANYVLTAFAIDEPVPTTAYVMFDMPTEGVHFGIGLSG